MNDEAKNFLYMILGFSTCILPLLSLPLLMYRRMIKNIELESRTERILPLSFVLIFYFMGYYLLNRLPLPNIINSYIAAVLGMGAIALLVTVWWKISLHMIGAGGLLGSMLALSLRLETDLTFYLYIILFVTGITASARLVLNSHNPLQVITGFFAGLTGVFAVLYFS
jgi:hypothetical protein